MNSHFRIKYIPKEVDAAHTSPWLIPGFLLRIDSILLTISFRDEDGKAEMAYAADIM